MGHLRVPRLALAVGAALLAACGREEGFPRVVLQVPPATVTGPTALVDFGTIEAGETHSRTLILRNEGTAPAQLVGWARADGTQVAALPPPFAFEPRMPILLAPGESRATFIRFSPAEESRTWKFDLRLRVDGQEAAAWPGVTLFGRTGPVPCELAVMPPSLDFGDVPEDGGLVRTVTLKNASTDPLATCSVSNLRLEAGTDPRMMFQARPPAYATLRPGQSLQVDLLALSGAPPTAEASGSLVFETIGAGTATTRVPLRAHFPADCVEVSPLIVSFPAQTVCGTSSERLVSVRNTCERPVQITSLQITQPGGRLAGEPGCPGPAACPEFVLGGVPAAPFQLAPEQAVFAPVTFKPLSWGEIQGELRVTSLYGAQPGRTDVSLVAREVRPDTKDVFENAEAPGIDVLVVLDHSPTLQLRERDLQWNVDKLVDRADALCADLNLGVTLGDISAGTVPGRLTSSPTAPAVLNWLTTPNFRQLAMSKVTLPAPPMSVAGPMEAMARALTPPLVQGANAGFLRDDARLVVILVSDRGDESPHLVGDYAQILYAVEATSPEPPWLEIVAGFNSALACGAEPDDGRYKELSLAHSGQTAEVCASDWKLLNLTRSWPCDVHRVRYPLSAVPVAGAAGLKVVIDDVEVPAGPEGPSAAWIYGPASNEVIFQQPPGPGRKIEITYTSLCGR